MIVDCRFYKWPDEPHWRFATELIGKDAFGTWVGFRPGTAYTGPRTGAFENAAVILVPDDEWWIASFNDESVEDAIYVDVCTPVTWHSDTHVSSIDLDLDVIRLRTGETILVDEDEFAENQIRYGYPADVIARAQDTASRMLDAVASGREPFATAGAKRLAAFS